MAVAISQAFNPSKRVGSRYFSQELLLPSLEPVTLEGRSFSSKLPLLYTNSPSKVSQWLADNVSKDGCTLGLDVEVSFVCAPAAVTRW